MVRKLPVTIVRSESTDETVLEFVAMGKTRVRLTAPLRASLSSTLDPPSGPSVTSEREECYDGEPPCIGWEEMEDLAIFTADSVAEAEAIEAGHNAQYTAYLELCNAQPWSCEGLPTSGPSESKVASCVGETLAALNAVAGAVATTVGARAAVQAGFFGSITLTASGAAWMWGGVALVIVTAVGVVGYAGACYLGYTVPALELVFEPAWQEVNAFR